MIGRTTSILLMAVISLSLSKITAAEEVEEIPNQNNWQSFSPIICESDIENPLSLRPVIFPTKYVTIAEKRPEASLYSKDIILVHGKTNQSGHIITPQLVDRNLPRLIHQHDFKRQLLPQYIGYLNSDDVLVDKTGAQISSNTPLQAELSPAIDDEVILNQEIPEGINISQAPREHDLFYKMEEASNCSMYIVHTLAIFSNLTLQKPIAVSPLSCKNKGGFYRPPPVTKIITRRSICLLYTSPSPRDATLSRMPSSA